MQTLSHTQEHTQGPCSCVPGKFFIVYSYVDDEPIAVPKTEANAALIAAAPGLLEALKYARRFLKPADADTAFIDAVITKAEGGAA